MTRMPGSTIGLAGFTLLVVAAIGSYLGYSKATAAPGGDAASGEVTRTLAAQAARPVTDGPATPVPDEAFIRKIAQDEVQSALHPKKPATAKADDGGDGDDNSDDHGPVAAAPPSAAAVAPITPAQVTPITPPPPPPPPTGLY